MQVTTFSARDFLSFGVLDLEVGPGLTIVTGPNGVGKTNLARGVDAVLAAVASQAGLAPRTRLDQYAQAGRYGSRTFELTLGIRLDRDWEKDLILNFVRSAYVLGGRSGVVTPADLEAVARHRLVADSLSPLWNGTLRVSYDAARRSPWFVAWEFLDRGEAWHLVLVGSYNGQLRKGESDAEAVISGTVSSLTEALNSTLFSDSGETINAPASPDSGALLDFRDALPSDTGAISLTAGPPSDTGTELPLSLRDLAAALGAGEDAHRTAFSFTDVMWTILHRGIVLTENRRVPLRRQFAPDELDGASDLRDGANVAALLYALKNGNGSERMRYMKIKDTFSRLTGRSLGLRTRHVAPSTAGGEDTVVIEPLIVEEGGEVLLEFSGAGRQEALLLSTLLSGEPGRVFVLDEPAVNLEPTMQRLLVSELRGVGQCLVITHSPDIVPVNEPGDLDSIVRLSPTTEGPTANRVGALDKKARTRLLKLLDPVHVRALLFAAKVILCEGTTELGALPRWWAQIPELPDPQGSNIAIISVDGQAAYGSYVSYLDAFAIPWAIVADGPALRHRSALAKQLRELDHVPSGRPTCADNFKGWRAYWSGEGVFTLADQFGDDGSKSGEFEAFLKRVDPTAYARAHHQAGWSKPRLGMLFALERSAPPEAIELYGHILEWLERP